MQEKSDKNGSVLLITIFVVAMLSIIVAGILQINTQEIQLMQNQIYAAEALSIAEAGLNDALAQIRTDNEWDEGFDEESFAGGSYTVDVSGDVPNLAIRSTATSARGFVAIVEAEMTVETTDPPYTIRIDTFRINEEDGGEDGDGDGDGEGDGDGDEEEDEDEDD